MANDATYGTLVSMEDTALHEMIKDTRMQEAQSPDIGNALWSYHNENRINGIPVDVQFRGLKIDTDDLLAAAFLLDRRPKSSVLYISPNEQTGTAEYDALLERSYNGEIIIVDELKQFDPASARFIVWIRYDEVRYTLHPRYNYLTEE